ncbi:MAG: alpha-E domain-containing protein [Hyphomicrobiales bacterium]|nr:alpha-E domain-containing protein [Hyphomicrobiales bacterium]
MLGRTADDLFWLSRYVERAENMARLTEVGYRITLMPRNSDEYREEWRSTLASAGCVVGFESKYGEFTTDNVVNYLLLDPENPSSVYSCMETARNKARSVRTAMTTDMWESLNATWLELSSVKPRSMTPNVLPGFLEWVKQRSQLFRGALLSTSLRNDNYVFNQLGAFMERADNTARILDVKYYILLPEHEIVGGGMDSYQWTTILRSVAAHRSYRWVYRESYRPWRIAEFLIQCKDMPRSLAYCYGQINANLVTLAEAYGQRHDCHEFAEETAHLLNGQTIDDIFQSGLHEFLTDFMGRNNRLSDDISVAYHFHD